MEHAGQGREGEANGSVRDGEKVWRARMRINIGLLACSPTACGVRCMYRLAACDIK